VPAPVVTPDPVRTAEPKPEPRPFPREVVDVIASGRLADVLGLEAMR
jgi:hypothetical protein